jgi:ubiquinone/menaquinone biosynthesis C-methylase UbiE
VVDEVLVRSSGEGTRPARPAEKRGWGRASGVIIGGTVEWLEQRRTTVVLRRIRGTLLDVGCGHNRLVRRYGSGIGVDVVDQSPDASTRVIDSSAGLPFPDGSFDTVTFLACLNHIPERDEALREARRVVKPDGQLIVTMIGPVVSQLWHRVVRNHDPDRLHRHMADGEVWGFRHRQVRRMLGDAGFTVVAEKPFDLWLNRMYVARPS